MKPLTNTHIHTPWSFSSFESTQQAVELAAQQQIRVLGISDFNTIDGFEEFAAACGEKGVYPLYNIEFISLDERDKHENRRWNDPQNPGVMYVCGKALAHPTVFSADSRNRLRQLWKATQDQIWKVINRLNEHLVTVGSPIALDYNQIRTRYARNTVRERHVCRALADAVREQYSGAEQQVAALRTIYADPSAKIDLADEVGLQNQVRSKLLKAGAPAYIAEDQSAFLPVEEVCGLILDGGGIPCYPVLADDKGGLGEYECDIDRLCDELVRRRFCAVEFIPARNTFDHLKRYVKALRDRGFCVTFGTEHNAPGMAPLVPSARGGVAFDEELAGIAWEGACILAAHAAARAAGKPGFVDPRGNRLVGVEGMGAFAKRGEESVRASAIV
jgi:hypothetical protein